MTPAFSWKDLLEFVEEVYLKYDCTPNEAGCRTIISRAYYAAFKSVQDWVASHAKSNIEVPEKHDETIIYLHQHPDISIKELAKPLTSLRFLRVWADYDPGTLSAYFARAEDQEGTKKEKRVYTLRRTLKDIQSSGLVTVLGSDEDYPAKAQEACVLSRWIIETLEEYQ